MAFDLRRLKLAALSTVALIALSGCDQLEKAIQTAFFVVVVSIVVGLVFQVVVVVVGVVGAVMLARKTPHLGWGIAGISCGVLQILPTGLSVIFKISRPSGLHAIGAMEVITLLYVGIRNVREAPR
jgi:hypothetical protein